MSLIHSIILKQTVFLFILMIWMIKFCIKNAQKSKTLQNVKSYDNELPQTGLL